VKASRSSKEVRKLLKAALREDECPSVPELSKRLGYMRPERLYQVDAALCHRITARHRASTRTHWWKQPGAKRICELDAIRSRLEKSLAQDPPIPVKRIAVQLGYTNGGFIQVKFPDLCHAIAERLQRCKERRIEALRDAVRAACVEEPPPTLHALSRRLGFQNSCTLRCWFRDETDWLLKARASHARKKKSELQAALLQAVSGEPSPSLSSVARQLGVSVSHLTENYPGLCRKIRSRYLRNQTERTRRRGQLLNEEVCRIANRLHSKGRNPTEPRIIALLSKGTLRQWGAVRQAVKRARRILGLP
jgi:plasmid stability protein